MKQRAFLFAPLISLCLTVQLHAKFKPHSKHSSIVFDQGTHFVLDGMVTSFSGTMVRNSGATFSGEDITFARGRFRDDGSDLNLTGKLSPSTAIIMEGDHCLRCDPGTTIDSIAVKSYNNRIAGTPSLSGAITLQDLNTTLTLALQGALDEDITLNNGKVILEDDLHFIDEYSITGSGVCDLQGRKVTFGAKDLTFTGTLTWRNVGEIGLHGPTSLTSQWIFQENATINGHGNILDLSTTGSLIVRPGVELYLNDVVIKSLGDASGSIILDTAASKVRMVNVNLALDSNYTTTMGNVRVDGQSTFTVGGSTWTFQDSGKLTVDGTTLWYDTLDSADARNIRPYRHDGTNLELLRSGRVVGSVADSLLYFNSASITLADAADLSRANKLTIEKATADEAGQKSVTLDGASFAMHFPEAAEAFIVLGDDVDATISDISLENFSPAQVQVGTNSRLVFGDDVVIKLGRDCSLTYSWVFEGNATIDGQGRELTLSDAEAIVVGHGKTLTIQDVRLDKLGGTSSAYPNNIRCLGSDSKVIFRNVEAVLESSFSFTVGAIDVEHDFSIDGFGKTFAYSSASNLTVKSRSMLMLDRGVTFSYDSSSAANDKLVFEDSSSTLKMFGSTLYSTHTGVSLSTGRLEVNDLCIFESEADNSAEAMIINTDLDVRVRAGAALDMRGMIVYE